MLDQPNKLPELMPQVAGTADQTGAAKSFLTHGDLCEYSKPSPQSA